MQEIKTFKDDFNAYLIEESTFDRKYDFPTLNKYEVYLTTSLVGFGKSQISQVLKEESKTAEAL